MDNLVPYVRKPKRKTSYHERYNDLSALDVYIRDLVHLQWAQSISFVQNLQMLLLTTILLPSNDEEVDFFEDEIFLSILTLYCNAVTHCLFIADLEAAVMIVTVDQQIPRLAPVNRNRTFDLLDPRWCYENTRFTVVQLWQLYYALNFQPLFQLGDRKYASSEESFIITVTKLATGKTNVALEESFGMNFQKISKIYRYTIGLLDQKCNGILWGNSLLRWVDQFQGFSDAIANKLMVDHDLHFDSYRIFGFLDCKIDETCRPGSGPMTDEPGAERYPDADVLQRSVYSGYLKRHGLKVLTVVLPNGIISHLYGPISARENDIGALNLSDLNRHLMALQPEITLARANGELVLYFSLFGDGFFPYLQCITHRHQPPRRGQLGDRQNAENNAMNSIRTSAEWPYETVTSLFHIMRSKHNKKFLLQDRLLNEVLHQQLRVVFFLYNCYVCLNGSKFGKFFATEPPSLNDYLEG